MNPRTNDPLVTTLLVNYNTRELLDECLGRLYAALVDLGDWPVIVVDNASRDGSCEHLSARWPKVQIIRSKQNVGFGRANNMALPYLQTPFLLLLNTDAFVRPDAIRRVVAFMEGHPKCGVLGVRLVGRDGALQPGCRRFPTPWNTFLARAGLERWLPGTLIDERGWPHDSERDCDWVPGCFYVIRREVLQQVGLFDPRYFMYYEEVDHCAMTKAAGWDVVFSPCTEVIHLGGESSAKSSTGLTAYRQIADIEMESALLYFRKWYGLSGLVRHVLLEHIASLVISLRAWAGRAPSHLAAAQIQHLRLLWTSLRSTRWGRLCAR